MIIFARSEDFIYVFRQLTEDFKEESGSWFFPSVFLCISSLRGRSISFFFFYFACCCISLNTNMHNVDYAGKDWRLNVFRNSKENTEGGRTCQREYVEKIYKSLVHTPLSALADTIPKAMTFLPNFLKKAKS